MLPLLLTFRSADTNTCSHPARRNVLSSKTALRGELLGVLVVEVENEVVGGGVADPEVEGGMLFELAQEVDRLLEVHREGRAALGEAFDRDLGGAELAD